VVRPLHKTDRWGWNLLRGGHSRIPNATIIDVYNPLDRGISSSCPTSCSHIWIGRRLSIARKVGQTSAVEHYGLGHKVKEIEESEALTVEIDRDGVIIVQGDIDIAGGPLLDEAIRTRSMDSPMTIDLMGVSFIDSSGLRSLLNASRRASERGASVKLRGVHHAVFRLLEITGTTERFTIETTDQ
jgi:anti-sigma B factor antagonist